MSAPSVLNGNMEQSVQHLPLAFDKSDSENSARKLVVALNPEWGTSPGPIEFVPFKDGITNTLYKAIKKRPGYSDRQVDQEAVLIRAYGSGTEVLIDREREARAHLLLAKNGLAPPLLGQFDNGLLYKFIEGDACSPEELQRSDVWPATALVLGKWHAVMPVSEILAVAGKHSKRYENIENLVPGKPNPSVWTTMQQWINALPGETQEQRDKAKTLQAQLEENAKRFGSTRGLDNGAYVCDHCDLLSGNVIVEPGEQRDPRTGKTIGLVSLIDYEYTCPGPAAFDLANHFAEWAGFECKYNLIPTRTQRRAFIEYYVDSYRHHQRHRQNGSHVNGSGSNGVNGHSAKTNGISLEADVDLLMCEVDECRGLPGLYWGIWALIQAMISDIDFDYVTYADDRFGEYWAWKAEDDGSRKRAGKEMPLRERRWAMEA